MEERNCIRGRGRDKPRWSRARTRNMVVREKRVLVREREIRRTSRTVQENNWYRKIKYETRQERNTNGVSETSQPSDKLEDLQERTQRRTRKGVRV